MKRYIKSTSTLDTICQNSAEGMTLRELFEAIYEGTGGDEDEAFGGVESAFGNMDIPGTLSWDEVESAWDSWIASVTAPDQSFSKKNKWDREFAVQRMTDSNLLDKIAHTDKSSQVKAAVARNKYTSEATRRYLAQTGDVNVRLMVAKKSSDLQTLRTLAENSLDNAGILIAIVSNLACTPELYQFIWDNSDGAFSERSIWDKKDYLLKYWNKYHSNM